MFRFTIRDLIWLTVVFACVAAWIADRQRLKVENHLLRERTKSLDETVHVLYEQLSTNPSYPPAQSPKGEDRK